MHVPKVPRNQPSPDIRTSCKSGWLAAGRPTAASTQDFKTAAARLGCQRPAWSVPARSGEGGGVVQDLDIARWRLRSQHLVSPYAVSAREAAGSPLAVQAENPSQAAWAVASRT
jgi:hypothetical protein